MRDGPRRPFFYCVHQRGRVVGALALLPPLAVRVYAGGVSRRIDPDTAVTVTVGIRLPTALLDLLDAEVDLVSAPGAQPTRASVARALLASVLVDRAAARAKPVPTKAPTPAPRAETKSRKPTIRDTVIAALHTAERPDTDTMSIPTVVRACIALHPVDAIHALSLIHI